ncbi:uroporphyrinogen decarboxylase isoform X1 [Amyelois transitella]|uniref:uroporphyrinogen decarboxylase isoform X1 n=2 Tax=Amyelois transitella TaxID=680683 RepID=UPI0029900DF3|nr:uroporphyrinogen decarboxylase isoform X1 [Amyelois transitella]
MDYTNKNFPELKNDRLLRAALGKEVDKVPVWVMRQAGRYLPEFQAVRAKHDFFTVCRTPELACEVTLQPLRRYEHLDASIIFSDILVIPQALGMTVEMHPGVGPVFPNPLQDPSDIDQLQEDGAVSRLLYVGKAITLTRHKIEGKVPLIGFTGAPFTLLGYMIEGGGSKTMAKTKDWLQNHSKDVHRLLQMLTRVIIDYLVMQVESGAQLLQVFESSADHLTREQFADISAPYLKDIRNEVKIKLGEKQLGQVPMTIFAKGAGHSLDVQSQLGYETIGLDWTVDPVEARKIVGDGITLQGNLDPQDLYKTPEEIRNLTINMVRKFGKLRYIANLGHGITPQTPLESMAAFTESVHEAL